MRDDDEELVERARQGDQRALERLAEKYRPKLAGFCGRFFRSQQDKEDAVQTTLQRALQAIRSFDGRAQFSTWLYRIATNVCLDILKGKGCALQQPLEEQGGAEPLAPGPSVEEQVIWRQMWEAVKTRAKTFKPPWDDMDWSICLFHCLREESFSQIARRLHRTEAAVKQRYYRKIEPVLKEVEREFGGC